MSIPLGKELDLGENRGIPTKLQAFMSLILVSGGQAPISLKMSIS